MTRRTSVETDYLHTSPDAKVWGFGSTKSNALARRLPGSDGWGEQQEHAQTKTARKHPCRPSGNLINGLKGYFAPAFVSPSPAA